VNFSECRKAAHRLGQPPNCYAAAAAVQAAPVRLLSEQPQTMPRKSAEKLSQMATAARIAELPDGSTLRKVPVLRNCLGKI